MAKMQHTMKRLAICFAFCLICFTSSAQLEMPAMEDLPVRLTRSIGISMDMGWNGLVGFGPTIQYFVSPHFGIDAGVGLSGTGIKLGGRGRYIFLEKKFSPFVGAGFNYGLGSRGNEIVLEDEGNVISFIVKPSPFLQLTAGGDLVTGSGFFMMFDLGYSILLVGENVELQSGTPTDLQQLSIDLVYGSGIVIEFRVGFIFKNSRSY